MSEIKVFGGLLLRNIIAGPGDRYYDNAMYFFEQGLIQGAQVMVEHPSFTPGLTLEQVKHAIRRLPEGFELLVHGAAENRGVDLGEGFDELGVYHEKGASQGISWREWNLGSLEWAVAVARSCPERFLASPSVVIHPGYMKSADEVVSMTQACFSIADIFLGSSVGLETVPWLMRKEWFLSDRPKGFHEVAEFFGFGGIPDSMESCLHPNSLPENINAKVLIDFSHIMVTWNQVQLGLIRDAWGSLDCLIGQFEALEHWSVCHYSGPPPGCVDTHEFMQVPPPECVRTAIRKMDTVCLEIPYENRERAEQDIRFFRTHFLG